MGCGGGAEEEEGGDEAVVGAVCVGGFNCGAGVEMWSVDSCAASYRSGGDPMRSTIINYSPFDYSTTYFLHR